MSDKYVPPHLRGKVGATATKPRGVHFPSNATGEESMNLRYKKAPTVYRNGSQTRSEKYADLSRRLSTRKVRSKPLKSVLKKGKRMTQRRRTV